MNAIDWLPDLVLFEHYQGNWDKYLQIIYQFFVIDFLDNPPQYQGRTLALKRHPIIDGKEATFWHIISEGSTEDDRTPDIRRCERIRWPCPIIEHCEDAVIKMWENQRKNETRICIWLEMADYLVVLARREGYDLFWTAYPITWAHQRRKLQKEYDAYIKANAAWH